MKTEKQSVITKWHSDKYPKGCIMTRKNRVEGQCDYMGCCYPWCERHGSLT
jgi:hypothetical protein